MATGDLSSESELWGQFNLAENNPDPGGGILYALRYSPEHLAAQRQGVVLALGDLGVRLYDLGEGIGAAYSETPVSEHWKIPLLLEELSVINEADEYASSGLGGAQSIPELVPAIRSIYFSYLEGYRSTGDPEPLAVAGLLVDEAIPGLIRDLIVAQDQSGVLSKKDQAALRELQEFSSRQSHVLASGEFVLFG